MTHGMYVMPIFYSLKFCNVHNSPSNFKVVHPLQNYSEKEGDHPTLFRITTLPVGDLTLKDSNFGTKRWIMDTLEPLERFEVIKKWTFSPYVYHDCKNPNNITTSRNLHYS